ncbi:hypothetical protein HY256_04820, partial [Candidatus Sumerlaeota bacterium]|nr:hypothetical protein [Candidatus Sumerlaeota bacterium]
MKNGRRLFGIAKTLGIAAAILAPSTLRADDTAGAPTFNKEVVRIFQNRCQDCHRTGIQFTPMGLMSYNEVRPWVKSIKKAVTERSMPPWHADPHFGKFKNELSMTQQEIDTIAAWADAGAPEGNPSDLPPPRQFAEGWQIGEPDVILDMGKTFEIPAEGIVPYQYFAVKTDFGEDKFIESMEARAGDLNVVHHIVMYIRNPRDGVQLPDKLDVMSAGLLGALSPGNTPSHYEPGQGKIIKRGATLIFNLHYTTNGTPATDKSYVGFRFQKTPVKQQVITRGIANVTFQIPPNEPNYEIKSSHTFDKDVTLISLMPHMHYRGKDFKYTAVYPDGREEILLSVPKYNFDWQVYYYLSEPKKFPAGTRLDCVAHFSNTKELANGRRYFDPDKPVRFGEQSWEEMMIGWID